MKFKKSVLSSIIAVIMVFSSLRSTLAIADTVDYESSLAKLQQLGIIESSITNTNSLVTRGQLVKTIAIADGLTTTDNSFTSATIFPDVKANSELSGYVNAVINAGTSTTTNGLLMAGMPDGKFHAEKGITYAETCTILIRLLGYKDADLSGAWPNNYIKQASTLKLTADINLKKNDKLTVGVEALLFDRLLETLMKKASSAEVDKYFSDIYYADTAVTGKLTEAVILGNSKTIDTLSDNQVLTDKGTLTLNTAVRMPVIGGKYKLYIDGTNITKVSLKENTQENYAITDVAGACITFTNDNNIIQTMILPNASSYYYRGTKLDYDAAAAAIQKYSSVILSKNSDGISYDYGIIVDPCFGTPQVYKTGNTELINKINDMKYDFIYKNNYSYANSSNVYLNNVDVVYFVSDLWNRNTFIYVNESSVAGEITALTPNKFNANSITIKVPSVNQVKVVGGQTVGGVTAGDTTTTSYQYTTTTYQLSQFFNKTSINNYNSTNNYNNNNINVGETRTLILGLDGKVVDIY